ncbi:MAG: hypothetical protein LBG99_03055 [Propionibacteriaceae bacterium]|nr:hypothetical protein [Propionibacteriaceae bacterium]
MATVSGQVQGRVLGVVHVQDEIHVQGDVHDARVQGVHGESLYGVHGQGVIRVQSVIRLLGEV